MFITKNIWTQFNWRCDSNIDCCEIENISYDSRIVTEKDAFFAKDGIHKNATFFIKEVVNKKVKAVFIDHKYYNEVKVSINSSCPTVLFTSNNFDEDSAAFIAYFFSNPSEKLHVVGVTGTNGKTSIALLLSQLYSNLKSPSIYMGTLGCFLPSTKIEFNMTTPDLIQINQWLQQGIQQKAEYAFIETSSHGIEQGRVRNIEFEIAIFTNLTQDHLDYHITMENYFLAKKKLFDQSLNSKKIKGFVINTDDMYGQRLFTFITEQNSIRKQKGEKEIPLISVGINNEAIVRITNIQAQWTGYTCDLIFNNTIYSINTQLLGIFNICNIAYCFSTALLLNTATSTIVEQIQHLKTVYGRMEIVANNQSKMVIVDYAHTPDALEKAILTAKELKHNKLILIFGCGGDRDHGKRAMMGKIADTYADMIIITNDNPRNEDGNAIIENILDGICSNKYKVISDRKQAIEYGISILSKEDILLIAGKGHENYQIIGSEKKYFSDQETVRSILNI